MTESTLIATKNLDPDSIVPLSGKYKCEFCGQGGIADTMAHLLNPGGLPTAKFEGLGRQQSVRFFEAGHQFTKCPNCGRATGWTLIEESSASAAAAHPRNDEAVLESGVCDICCQRVSSPDGYLLTTREVVSTPAYWKYYFRVHQREFVPAGVSSYQDFCRNAILRTSCGESLARQTTPWMVCENCIRLFAVDAATHREYAKRWWQSKRTFSPPGNGPVPLSAVVMSEAGGMVSSTPKQPGTFAATRTKWWEFWKK